MKAMLCFLLCCVPQVVNGQCYRSHGYNYSYTPYVAPVASNYYDNRLVVSYTIYPPAPSVVGNTVYQNTPPGGLSQFDVGEAIKLRTNAGQRYAELGQQIIQSSETIASQNNQIVAGELELRKLEAIERLLAPAPNLQGSSSYYQKKTTVNGVAVPEPMAAAAGPVNLQATVAAKCTECHGGAKRERGLDLRDLTALDAPTVEKIVLRILSDDPTTRMPPIGHPALTAQEKIAFIAGAIGNGEQPEQGKGVKAPQNGNGGEKPPPKPPMPAPVQPAFQSTPPKPEGDNR